MRRYGIVFDVDGVIADTETVNAVASMAVFAEMFGLENVRREDFRKGLGRGAGAYMKAAATVHGLVLDDEKLAEAVQARQDNFLAALKAKPLEPFDGVMAIMEAATEREDFSLAIATSSTREKSQAVLDAVGIDWRRLCYITGSDVTHKKPHPELFITAAAGLQIQPGCCVVIEDAPDGVAAAKAAGCACVAVTNSAPAEALAQADAVVDSLAGVTLDDLVALIK